MPVFSSKRLSLAWRIALTVWMINALYATTYLGNPMSKSILALTVSLVDRGALNIDPYAGISTDISWRRGHYYSGLAPGTSIAAIPYYLALKPVLWFVATPERERAADEMFLRARVGWKPSPRRLTLVALDLFVCVFGFAALAGAMAAMFHAALARLYPECTERQRLATVWLFAFGTLWFVYSPGVYHRVLSTTLCFGAFLLALVEEERESPRRERVVVAGLALGFAIATTYEAALVAAVLYGWILARWRRRWPWGWMVAGTAMCVALLAIYHTICFGAPWRTPYSFRIAGSVAPPLFQEGGEVGGDALGRVYAFLFGTRFGFFFYSPVLILAVAALWHAKQRQHRVTAYATAAFGMFMVLFLFHFVSGYRGLPGEFGFRLMLPVIPFLMLMAPLSYRWAWPWAAAALAGVSAMILGKGVMYGMHAGRPAFWGDYLDYAARFGFANYTLANLKDNVWPGLSPWMISAIHVAALGVIVIILWRLIWRKE